MSNISVVIAQELSVNVEQVNAAIKLMDEGSTVPFIARYRKEVTGGLDDIQLRTLEQRLIYLRELEDRKETILKSIDGQKKLTPELKREILSVQTKTELEDLYLPYKPRRVTKGQLAIEAGLEPLADVLLLTCDVEPEMEAIKYVSDSTGITCSADALDGARYILMERLAMDAKLIAKVRAHLKTCATLDSKVIPGNEDAGVKFKDYFESSEKFSEIPSHRALAMFRGRNESILSLKLNADPEQEETKASSYCEYIIEQHLGLSLENSLRDLWLKKVIKFTWKIKINYQLETEFIALLKDNSEEKAISVFADNLKDLLMASPAGAKVTMGLDPGLRTGTKLVVIDQTGKVLDTATIYPHAPQNQWDKSLSLLIAMVVKYDVKLIAIGNGTASRETDRLAKELIKKTGKTTLAKIIVSEAGASVYSASELASNEFPDMDVSIRGAVSIARRLQDPLAELVKIEPKAIGVGQYQHDVCQASLSKGLDAVVEDCVNNVGVDLNTASVPLLTKVSGLNKSIAENIVSHRELQGRFNSREELKSVSRLGAKAFEQSAGFLKISGGSNPLDNSGVHPESYSIVESFGVSQACSLDVIIGNKSLLKKINASEFVTDIVGLMTVKDIIKELAKPGRDPRPEFKTAEFKEGVETVGDLKESMILEGVISNVTQFGAFVDLGVHQDGLVHISALSDKFVKDPREVVKTGDVVRVKVVSVSENKKRIALTMRLNDDITSQATIQRQPLGAGRRQTPARKEQASGNSAMADAWKTAVSGGR